MSVLVPDLVMLPGCEVRGGLAVEIEDGRIAAVRPPLAGEGERLAGVLLAPACVNAHSHAFQVDLRGRVERVDPARPHDDFWTWREEMYAAATRLDPEAIRDVSLACFRQARAAGYATVGEFHYVHHRPDGGSYDEPNALALAVISAAREAGVRIVLLLAAYARAGAGLEPTSGQRRFCDASADAYLARVESLCAEVARDPLVSVGYAPHSVRAVPRDWLEAIALHRRASGLVCHIHADEQPREIRESIAEHGCRPIELLDRVGLLDERCTVVHATHADDAELDLLAARGATVCACPTTEANLGDGFLPAERLWERGVPVCFGSDSNTRLDPWEEARETEGLARRQSGLRNRLLRAGEAGPARSLWECLTAHGARALGVETPRIEAGAPADLVALDLTGHELARVPAEHLPAATLFAGSPASVRATWVAGRRA